MKAGVHYQEQQQQQQWIVAEEMNPTVDVTANPSESYNFTCSPGGIAGCLGLLSPGAAKE